MGGDILIGVGNPMISDDAVGLEIARRCRAELPPEAGVAIVESHCGGMRLMEAMVGYDRAIVVDAMASGGEPGTVYCFNLDAAPATRNTCTTHDGSLSDALQLGRIVGTRVPNSVRVWAVEAGDLSTIREGLTDAVEAAVPIVTAEIMRELLAARRVGR